MKDYLSFILMFVVLSTLLYVFLKRRLGGRLETKEKRFVNHQPQDPHTWTLRVIKTNGQNADGSSRPLLIETVNPQDSVSLQYSLEEKCYEVQNRRRQTLGYLPHSSTDRIRMYQAAGKLSTIIVKHKGGSSEHPELVIDIEVKP